MKKRFLIQLGVTLAVVLIIGTVAYYLICAGLRHSKSDAIGKFNYLIHDTTHYNTVFFGSSTFHAGMDPFTYDSLTGSHSYNAAVDGLGITELHMFIRKYFKSHGTPQRIFIGLDEQTLTMQKGVWYFPQYYPFVGDTDLKEMVTLEPKLLLGKYFPPAAVTYFDDPLKNLALIGLLRDRKKTKYDLEPRGFKPIVNKKLSAEAERIAAYFTGSEKGWALLENILAECQSKKVDVSIVLPPRYNYVVAESSADFFTQLKMLEQKFGTRTFSYATDSRFSAKELFFDRTHLNDEGARLFTNILARESSQP
jgi:hypothetical protein